MKETRHKLFDVAVIGGGPAGMMAAGRAAERGFAVVLLEKNASLGKKLLITGGGRCNVTNNKEVRTMLGKYKGNDKFLFSTFAQFNTEDALNFFHSRGMATKEENEGRIFPASNKAVSVWNVLVEYIKKGDVQVRTEATVTDLAVTDKQFEVLLKDGSTVFAKSCIIATGGLS
ncbi:aminoacetone oxidase family FAD-binding enzyme [Candidatus Uhrbacteria bacterium CG10_big_fil_rev_8_21_14_0_10_48_11]|uniref:Aminoacetone oxidase family FAD-binding enzyme n=1 Tax=Candidatus Uhrbacteria bacterium CG10_big_fil_rev_8_21_14_0_10_48_11 TaxID=1975037 RepID=A0A2M8LEM0_9BACT|nr:MAG: aminoacetone oxidase family FAD-binding enzyme [Candidatus Uhrbacteria bacterium CG10_big_fil_rev_8_21_14_0_10_48_11]